MVSRHGSSVILPLVHTEMAFSVIPSRRWGNFIEDLVHTEQDVWLAAFQRRVVPMNTILHETIDIATDMLLGRACFVKKFIYDKTIS